MSIDFLTDLTARGLIHQQTSPALADALRGGAMTGYIGFDPTASSLHVGSLLQLVMLRRFQLAGHQPIALVGGGTGMIGDPSGKEDERTLLSREKLDENLAGIRAQIERLLDCGPRGAKLVNNADWLCEVRLLDFLRDIGKHFAVNEMVKRDSVRMRIDTREHGISFTEFSYILLQSYDFLELHDRCGCRLQMGGSDQWGNIVSGTDLVRRLRGVEAFGLTFPLITRSDGKKFGKTEEGNVWLDPERTSPYEMYQFWLNVDDKDVVHYLKAFTFMPLTDVDALSAAVVAEPQKRAAQRVLAEQMTRMVHGDAALARAQKATTVLFDKDADWRQLSAQELAEAFRGAPSSTLAPTVLGTPDASLVAILADCGLYPSRGQARKDLPQGSMAVNNIPIRDANHALTPADVLPGGFIILRKGKRHFHVLRIATA